MVNEFGLSDVETAYWLGVQSWLLVVFGMLGAVLVDATACGAPRSPR